MARIDWLHLLEKFCVSNRHRKPSKGLKGKKRIFGRPMNKRHASSPTSSSPRTRPLSSTADDQKKLAKNVAMPSAAVAYGTVMAVQVTTEVAQLAGYHQCSEEMKSVPSKTKKSILQDSYQIHREIQNLAATKIQTAYRGHLARKALRALKGLVRLQAIIRGWAVRRQAITTLKCLQSVVSIQSEVCAKRCGRSNSELHCQEEKLLDPREKDIKIDLNSQRKWDDSILTREEATALFISKREASIRRERIKEYALAYRRSTESEQDRIKARRRYWLEQWVDAQLAKREDFQKLDTHSSANAITREDIKGRELDSINIRKQYQVERMVSPLHVQRRRSFHHKKQNSVGDDCCYRGSPDVPTYMAATASAKAKARSMSSPRLRPINLDVHSDINSPYKHKLSPISFINSEVVRSSSSGYPIGFSLRSPYLKDPHCPIRSCRSLKMSLDSETSLPNWDSRGTYKKISG